MSKLDPGFLLFLHTWQLRSLPCVNLTPGIVTQLRAPSDAKGKGIGSSLQKARAPLNPHPISLCANYRLVEETFCIFH